MGDFIHEKRRLEGPGQDSSKVAGDNSSEVPGGVRTVMVALAGLGGVCPATLDVEAGRSQGQGQPGPFVETRCQNKRQINTRAEKMAQ